jgi:hypothetical protein
VLKLIRTQFYPALIQLNRFIENFLNLPFLSYFNIFELYLCVKVIAYIVLHLRGCFTANDRRKLTEAPFIRDLAFHRFPVLKNIDKHSFWVRWRLAACVRWWLAMRTLATKDLRSYSTEHALNSNTIRARFHKRAINMIWSAAETTFFVFLTQTLSIFFKSVNNFRNFHFGVVFLRFLVPYCL